jgi:formylglycine-generating enzyme required for sulfatase activity
MKMAPSSRVSDGKQSSGWSPPEPGSVYAGKYRIIEPLGTGGFGIVFKVEHILLGQVFALKFLRPELLSDPMTRTRFVREARAVSSFSHPHVVTLREFGIEGGAPYMAIDYAPGKPLGEHLAEGPMPPETAAEIMFQLLDAVGAAHQASIVHRDLKPANILVETRADGTKYVRILDFGVARIIDETSDSHPTTGGVVGTVGYLAPEQALGRGVDGRCDIYACGVMLYEMLTGLRPTGKAQTIEESLAQVVHAIPEPPSGVRPELKLPVEFDPIVLRALEKNPTDRYQRAEQFRDALAALFSERYPGVLRSREAVLRGDRRFRPRLGGVLFVLLVLGAVGVARWASENVAPPGPSRGDAKEAVPPPASPAAARENPPVAKRVDPPKASPARIRGKDGRFMALIPGGTYKRGTTSAELHRLVGETVLEADLPRWRRSLNRPNASLQMVRDVLLAILERELRERPEETLPGFYLDERLVSEEDYQAFLDALGPTGHNPAWCDPHEPPGAVHWHWRGADGQPSSFPPARLHHPAMRVSFWDATAYASFAGKRLPTVAELERAARGPNGRRYPWGDDYDPAFVWGASGVQSLLDGREATVADADWAIWFEEVFMPAAEKRGDFLGFTASLNGAVAGACRTPEGVQCLVGNVSQWCSDSRGNNRALFGASWKDTRLFMRAAWRPDDQPADKGRSDVGFRCAAEVP